MARTPSKLLPEYWWQEIWAGTLTFASRLCSALLGADGLVFVLAKRGPGSVCTQEQEKALLSLRTVPSRSPSLGAAVLHEASDAWLCPLAGTPELSAADRKELETKLKEREEFLSPIYHQVAMQFADLHDTPGRMQEKGAITVSVALGTAPEGLARGKWQPQSTGTSCSLAPLPGPCPSESPHFLGDTGSSSATASRTPPSTLRSAPAAGGGGEGAEPGPLGTLCEGRAAVTLADQVLLVPSPVGCEGLGLSLTWGAASPFAEGSRLLGDRGAWM